MSSGDQILNESSQALAAQELVALAETNPLEAAERIMALLRSPAGCPWDREQSFDSIRRHTLEEVYEVFDAIDRRAWPQLQDELGDLLLQVLFYAQMAAESGYFDLADVARSLSRKLIRRHPHIFAETRVSDSAEVIRNWDEIKRQERLSTPQEQPVSLLSHLDVVPRSMPALMEAGKLGSAAAKIGFDWNHAAAVVSKVREELAELEEELRAHMPMAGRTHAAIEDEFGDVLFSMVSLARHLHVDAEMALRGANAKFRRRFEIMEEIAAKQESTIDGRSAAELELLWAEAKRRLAEEPKTEGAPA